MKFRLLTLLGLLLAVTSTLRAQVEFRTAPNDRRNVLTFKSEAPLETIVGTNNTLRGSFRFDPQNITGRPAAAEFIVDAEAFKTGIELRDQHLRENYLETAKYPQIRFTLDRIVSASKNALRDGETAELLIEGTFELHGQRRREQLRARITYMAASEATRSRLPGNLLRVVAEFPIKYVDYGIQRPQVLLLKLSEVVTINVDMILSDAKFEATN
ncbi:MAG: YceI family protein [Bacteroidetes bacterium]|nr:YceI family protein [Rhodothermia bacterium]MCS7154847.1 YceI family protein [Bacteroidota bacterium]MCX7906995.1 YceI family protein [Bacteroidota bacterium]MDW8137641.1 YceI family protein [Bacteroidota bacterium]MDW8285405.1 YceI family protein [Bacteroidota bacterium]